MPILWIIVAIIIGAGTGFGLTQFKNKTRQADHQKQLEKTRQQADKILKEARSEAQSNLDKAQSDIDKRRQELNQFSDRLEAREKKLDDKQEKFDQSQESHRQEVEDLNQAKDKIYEIRQQQEEKLAKIAKLTKKEAADKLYQMVEKNTQADLKDLIAKLQTEAKAEAEDNARAILISAMERLASETTAERTITTVKIDSEDIKGRIIGKEGRNIQTLQKITGVDILVDDSPGVIVLSCFDPVRREVARQTLEMLIKDGRIHPARIEELLEKAQKQVQKEVVQAAETAAREIGVIGIPPTILQLLGELKFRTSYGQNVLKHSVEMAHLAGVLSEQIGADTAICKYAALVHDLGKALTHKMEGKHHHLSGEMLRKYGVDEKVAHAAEAHHDDIEATTIEALVIRVVDAVSAARPGARNISAENFVERMKTLENIANSFKGIEKSYAISAGREMRVFVKPSDLDDLQSLQVARDIALKIESMMNYPGTIKVTVIRETRAIEYAK
ncbi:MAG: ribonuclease Y [Candidatus Saccharibacteria bacterium]|nr:ribonuclease Y [Candidatus Saccharibacteria bacterium]MCY4088674.1 ribonuclease Y [Candidatus Saccharibacteria bacterium]